MTIPRKPSPTSSHSLLQWTEFHPFAPTIDELRMEKLSGHSAWILVIDSQHAIAPQRRVLAKLEPKIMRNKSLLLATLQTVFSNNGGGCSTLFESIPSAILIARNPLLSCDDLAPLISLALLSLDPTGAALEQQGRSITNHFCDPWTRSMEKFFLDTNPSDSTSELPMTHDARFEQWWKVASDPWHAKAEFAACEAATETARLILSLGRTG